MLWQCHRELGAPITCDRQIDIDDLKQAIPRMKQLGVPFIRVMSYPNDAAAPLGDAAWRAEAIARMKVLARMAEDAGIVLAHENCSGWGASRRRTATSLLGEVDSPALKVVFDTGNPVTYGQDAWEYYQAVRADIAYVHIKDARKVADEDHYCYCGEARAMSRPSFKTCSHGVRRRFLHRTAPRGRDPHRSAGRRRGSAVPKLHRVWPPPDGDHPGSQHAHGARIIHVDTGENQDREDT
ncbi:MAG: sugar phosphate isomerase/epimerase [Candidatus Competibacteraceae bacterium]|nr:sugar phosphate isomerase/epimerase [Candidatus Competibacteraceae bacterium]